MKRTIIQLSEEQLDYLLDSMPIPTEDESPIVRSLRERLQQALLEMRQDKDGKAVADYSNSNSNLS